MISNQLLQSGRAAFNKTVEEWLGTGSQPLEIQEMTLLYAAGHILKQDNGE